MTFGDSEHLRIRSLKNLSIFMNLTDSAGSCFWMSSAPKMFSRYIHERWQASHSSSTSESSPSFFSHSSTSVRMPLTKREARMVCSETWLG